MNDINTNDVAQVTNSTDSNISDDGIILQKKINGYLKDPEGNRCMRRLCGIISIIIGGLMGIILFWYGLIYPNSDYESSYRVFTSFLTLAGTLLGLSIFDSAKTLFKKSK